jgi:mannose-6-phosphate isomerase-like protein (cupin superfamily)
MELAITRAADQPVVVAPDGSAVRVLCTVARGGMALFTLAPGAVSRAVSHRTVEEVWYVVAGAGRMWRRLGDAESIVTLAPGTAIALPTGTRFQFRCDGAAPLVAVGATMPPWPGADEAQEVAGPWTPTV